MKRPARILFKTLPTLCLFLASITLWSRSYFVVDSFAWNGKHSAIHISTSDCTLEFWHFAGRLDSRPERWSHESRPNDRPEYLWGWYEFRTDNQFKIAIPLWLLTLITALSFATCLLARHAHRRRLARKVALQPARCPKCGYDTRATPARCPECGTEPAPQKATPTI